MSKKRRVFVAGAASTDFELPLIQGQESFEFIAHPRGDADEIRKTLETCIASVIIIGPRAADAAELVQDVELSVDAGIGVVGLRTSASEVPDALYEAGAEILEWDRREDIEYLPEALDAAYRGARLLERASKRGTGTGQSCARQPRS